MKNYGSYFFHNYLVWKHGYDIFDRQHCFAINFGFEESLSIPQMLIQTNIRYSRDVDIGAPTNCYIVLISGKYVQELHSVLDFLDNLSGIIGTKPITIFIVSRFQRYILPITDRKKIASNNIVMKIKDTFNRILYIYIYRFNY